MNSKQIMALVFGVFVILLIASTGAFSEIIKGFSSALGDYGIVIGFLIVILIILMCFGIWGRR